jgi:hypothetical protein
MLGIVTEICRKRGARRSGFFVLRKCLIAGLTGCAATLNVRSVGGECDSMLARFLTQPGHMEAVAATRLKRLSLHTAFFASGAQAVGGSPFKARE